MVEGGGARSCRYDSRIKFSRTGHNSSQRETLAGAPGHGGDIKGLLVGWHGRGDKGFARGGGGGHSQLSKGLT